jgi:hypothetical protein
MAAKRGTNEETIVDFDSATPIENDITAVEESVLAAFDATDSNVTWDIRVYKLDKSAGNAEEYLFSTLPDELDGIMDRVRDGEGTGTYRVRAYRKQGQRKQVFKQTDFRVKAPTKPIQPAERQSDMAAVLAAINSANEKTLQVLQRLAERPQTTLPAVLPQNPFEMMTQMVTAMSGIMAVMRPAEGSTATDLILKGVQFANELRDNRGDDDSEGGMMGLVTTLLKSPLVAQIAQAQSGTVPPASFPTALPAPARVVPPNPSQIAPAPNNSQAEDQALIVNEIKKTVLYLLGKAKKNSDPIFYADWTADEWPPQMVMIALQQPDLYATMQTLVPEIAPHAEWFRKLIDELRAIVVNAQSTTTGGEIPDVPRERSPVQPITNPGWNRGNESNLADHERAD